MINNNRYLSKTFLLSLLLLSFSFLQMFYVGLTSEDDLANINIFINDYGIANIIIYANISIGLSNITLPIAPLEASISVTCGGSELPFIYEEHILYISSGQLCRASIGYIADLPYSNGVFNLSISLPSKITLIISNHVLLLTIPNNIVSVSKKGNSTILEFFGPTTILYTITLQTTTIPITTITTQQIPSPKQTLSTSPTSFPSPSPASIETPTSSSSESPTISYSSPYISQQTQSPTGRYPLVSIGIITILLILLIIAIVVILMKRK